jgi:hypothetical protein
MQGVAVPADLGEPLDVIRGDSPGQLGGLADRGWPARPAGVHGVVLPVMVMAGPFGLILRFRLVSAANHVPLTPLSRNPIAVWAVSAVPR